MPKNPLAEVFGFPVDNMSNEAINHRRGRLCPFHNSSGINCTKSSATDPIGVCTIFDGKKIVSTCPIRFREDFQIVADAADFFFAGSNYVALTEARLKDLNGKSAGNIDIVIAALDSEGEIWILARWKSRRFTLQAMCEMCLKNTWKTQRRILAWNGLLKITQVPIIFPRHARDLRRS